MLTKFINDAGQKLTDIKVDFQTCVQKTDKSDPLDLDCNVKENVLSIANKDNDISSVSSLESGKKIKHNANKKNDNLSCLRSKATAKIFTIKNEDVHSKSSLDSTQSTPRPKKVNRFCTDAGNYEAPNFGNTIKENVKRPGVKRSISTISKHILKNSSGSKSAIKSKVRSKVSTEKSKSNKVINKDKTWSSELKLNQTFNAVPNSTPRKLESKKFNSPVTQSPHPPLHLNKENTFTKYDNGEYSTEIQMTAQNVETPQQRIKIKSKQDHAKYEQQYQTVINDSFSCVPIEPDIIKKSEPEINDVTRKDGDTVDCFTNKIGKLTIQQLPHIDIRRSLVMQSNPLVVITPQETIVEQPAPNNVQYFKFVSQQESIYQEKQENVHQEKQEHVHQEKQATQVSVVDKLDSNNKTEQKTGNVQTNEATVDDSNTVRNETRQLKQIYHNSHCKISPEAPEENITHNQAKLKTVTEEMNLEEDIPSINTLKTIQSYLEKKCIRMNEDFKNLRQGNGNLCSCPTNYCINPETCNSEVNALEKTNELLKKFSVTSVCNNDCPEECEKHMSKEKCVKKNENNSSIEFANKKKSSDVLKETAIKTENNETRNESHQNASEEHIMTIDFDCDKVPPTEHKPTNNTAKALSCLGTSQLLLEKMRNLRLNKCTLQSFPSTVLGEISRDTSEFDSYKSHKDFQTVHRMSAGGRCDDKNKTKNEGASLSDSYTSDFESPSKKCQSTSTSPRRVSFCRNVKTASDRNSNNFSRSNSSSATGPCSLKGLQSEKSEIKQKMQNKTSMPTTKQSQKTFEIEKNTGTSDFNSDKTIKCASKDDSDDSIYRICRTSERSRKNKHPSYYNKPRSIGKEIKVQNKARFKRTEKSERKPYSTSSVGGKNQEKRNLGTPKDLRRYSSEKKIQTDEPLHDESRSNISSSSCENISECRKIYKEKQDRQFSMQSKKAPCFCSEEMPCKNPSCNNLIKNKHAYKEKSETVISSDDSILDSRYVSNWDSSKQVEETNCPTSCDNYLKNKQTYTERQQIIYNSSKEVTSVMRPHHNEKLSFHSLSNDKPLKNRKMYTEKQTTKCICTDGEHCSCPNCEYFVKSKSVYMDNPNRIYNLPKEQISIECPLYEDNSPCDPNLCHQILRKIKMSHEIETNCDLPEKTISNKLSHYDDNSSCDPNLCNKILKNKKYSKEIETICENESSNPNLRDEILENKKSTSTGEEKNYGSPKVARGCFYFVCEEEEAEEAIKVKCTCRDDNIPCFHSTTARIIFSRPDKQSDDSTFVARDTQTKSIIKSTKEFSINTNSSLYQITKDTQTERVIIPHPSTEAQIQCVNSHHSNCTQTSLIRTDNKQIQSTTNLPKSMSVCCDGKPCTSPCHPLCPGRKDVNFSCKCMNTVISCGDSQISDRSLENLPKKSSGNAGVYCKCCSCIGDPPYRDTTKQVPSPKQDECMLVCKQDTGNNIREIECTKTQHEKVKKDSFKFSDNYVRNYDEKCKNTENNKTVCKDEKNSCKVTEDVDTLKKTSDGNTYVCRKCRNSIKDSPCQNNTREEAKVISSQNKVICKRDLEQNVRETVKTSDGNTKDKGLYEPCSISSEGSDRERSGTDKYTKEDSARLCEFKAKEGEEKTNSDDEQNRRKTGTEKMKRLNFKQPISINSVQSSEREHSTTEGQYSFSKPKTKESSKHTKQMKTSSIEKTQDKISECPDRQKCEQIIQTKGSVFICSPHNCSQKISQTDPELKQKTNPNPKDKSLYEIEQIGERSFDLSERFENGVANLTKYEIKDAKNHVSYDDTSSTNFLSRKEHKQKPKRNYSSNSSTSVSESLIDDALDVSLSEGEIKLPCKCNLSIGEVNLCTFADRIKRRVNNIKVSPEKMIVGELGLPKVRIQHRKKHLYTDNFVTYYTKLEEPIDSEISCSDAARKIYTSTTSPGTSESESKKTP